MGSGLAALHLAPPQLVGRTLSDYFHTHDPAFASLAAHRRALAGEAVSYEQEWAGRVYQAHVEPLRARDGQLIGTIGVALDITDRERAAVIPAATPGA